VQFKQRSNHDAARRTKYLRRKRAPFQGYWRLTLGLAMSTGIALLVILNRGWLLEALSLARTARPLWLAAALLIILTSYMISGQVLRVALWRSGRRIGTLRAGITALVAIIISQSMPAGGVGGYAFLVGTFKRSGMTTEQSALVAALEALSYASAMVLIALFSVAYLALHISATGASSMAFLAPLLAALGVIATIVAGVAALTQNLATLQRWFTKLNVIVAHVRPGAQVLDWPSQLAARIARGRALILENRRTLGLLIGIQLSALCGHSLAMLLILQSLGVHTSFAVVLAAFGAALVTSLLNVLPGGGGTIETILAAVLGLLGTGPAAILAAIIFRLLNFWLLLPFAALAYAWMIYEPLPRSAS
jgi:uncharacterized membrane protein YbhN (UPF0104 family)